MNVKFCNIINRCVYHILLLCFLATSLNASRWWWAEKYPWVYDNNTSEWIYLAHPYVYSNKTKDWVLIETYLSGSELFDPNDAPSNLTVKLTDSVALDLVFVQPGTFIMGSPESEEGRVARPAMDFEIQHEVTISKGFYLAKYETTQAQYEAVTGVNPSGAKGSLLPVDNVSHEDVIVFMTQLNELRSDVLPEGFSFGLPTESEWEYACRAGTSSVYSWGNEWSSLYANKPGLIPIQVGSYSPNAWGFYDMHGNVVEWVLDLYAFYPQEPTTDPRGIQKVHESNLFRDRKRVARSGRSAARGALLPDYKNVGLGFRIAVRQTN